MSHFSLNPGHVHLVWPAATKNIKKHVPQHPVAVVRAPIGHVWAGAMRTSRSSSQEGGSKPSEPIESLGLYEKKNWNVDPVVQVLEQSLNTQICRYVGQLPSSIEKEVTDLYKSWVKAEKDRELIRRINSSLPGVPRRKR